MGALDTFIVYKFIKLLTTPWDETDAFKQGVIDASGKLLKKVNDLNYAQSQTYTLFHRLVYNIKRLIEKVPGGKSKIGTYAAALYLLKEEMGDKEGELIMERAFMSFLKDEDALEPNYLEEQYLPEEMLPEGVYRLLNTMLDTKGEHIPESSIVTAGSNLNPIAKVLGIDVFRLEVPSTGRQVIVSHDDISAV